MQCEAAQLEACALWALGRSNLEADPSVSSWIKVLWEKHGNTSWPWQNFQSQTFPTSWPWLQTSSNHKCAKPEKLHWQLYTLAESILKHAQNVRGKAALPFAMSEVNYFSTESSS